MKKVSEADWLKLADYARITARELRKKLPSDWAITEDDITSVALGEVAHLIMKYREGAMSLTSYVYGLLKLHVGQTLNREWDRLSRQMIADGDAVITKEGKFEVVMHRDEDDRIGHEYGQIDIEDSESLDEQIEKRDMVRNAIDRATVEDREIMGEIMQGLSYDEIAQKHGITKAGITRRMKRYAV